MGRAESTVIKTVDRDVVMGRARSFEKKKIKNSETVSKTADRDVFMKRAN